MGTFQCIEPNMKPFLDKLGANLRKAISEILQVDDVHTKFHYRVIENDGEFYFLLLEQNVADEYTVCHCFFTDPVDRTVDQYRYESISLKTVHLLSQFSVETGLTC
ncbi:hypothetical protein [Paenibacillus sp. MSJ-34]|uniref:hypothetical protein n=1 Tax=Paenibacillus sp. MSJ-34 TaxID=2841529 RepID=UPI001C0FBBF8|nr:hypothetical protein [Paenibacillus sp. MSJ-34]MBU5442420.1 hypothetical protein [Paenibacillus sp. MSJ-34]